MANRPTPNGPVIDMVLPLEPGELHCLALPDAPDYPPEIWELVVHFNGVSSVSVAGGEALRNSGMMTGSFFL